MDDRRDEAIKSIIEDFLECRWRVGRSHREYAAKYGVELVTVRGWAAEASRFLRLCRGNEEEMRERMLAQLDEISKRCMEHEQVFYTDDGDERRYPKPDYRNWIGALELQARVNGITKNEQPGAAGNTGSPMEIPVEELKAALEQAGYRIEKVSDGSSRKDREKG